MQKRPDGNVEGRVQDQPVRVPERSSRWTIHRRRERGGESPQAVVPVLEQIVDERGIGPVAKAPLQGDVSRKSKDGQEIRRRERDDGRSASGARERPSDG